MHETRTNALTRRPRYWQEQIDAGNFRDSVVLSPETGFGGNGNEDDGCIQDGPFADYRNQIGLGYTKRDQCIRRRLNETASVFAAQDEVDGCLGTGDWLNAWACIEGRPHYAGHAGVGEQMANPVSSPGDPLFYLHHTWLDKMWWDWQSRDLPARLSEMGGENRQFGNNDGPEPCNGEDLFGALPDEIPYEPSYKDLRISMLTCNRSEPRVEGDDGGCRTTLNHVLDMKGIIEDRRIGDVMDIQGQVLCYEYVEP